MKTEALENTTTLQVHSEFWALDSHSFHTGQPGALISLFGEDIKQASWDAEALKAAHRLSTVFTTLKSQPSQIYVRTPTELPDVPLNSFRAKACQCVPPPAFFPSVKDNKPLGSLMVTV